MIKTCSSDAIDLHVDDLIIIIIYYLLQPIFVLIFWLPQRAVLVPAMEGRDIIGRAKTGTGKTLAFGIPILKALEDLEQGRDSLRYICT